MKRKENGSETVLPVKEVSVINKTPVRLPKIIKLIIINEFNTCRTLSISIFFFSELLLYIKAPSAIFSFLKKLV